MSKYGIISGLYFPSFSPNTGKYRPEITPYLDTFHAVVLGVIAKTLILYTKIVKILSKIVSIFF